MAFLTGCLLLFHYSYDYNFSFDRVSVVVQLTNKELNSLRGTDLGREETTGKIRLRFAGQELKGSLTIFICVSHQFVCNIKSIFCAMSLSTQDAKNGSLDMFFGVTQVEGD